ncbi:hypothetical protein M9Y10_012917 [Tritrichomonas musculus]|uniref:Protein kinase domain-containing protein n=1 Tax=Tritrichomonas musculus TaxID=1915356 RepID=A0ABR2I711_9EUKA
MYVKGTNQFNELYVEYFQKGQENHIESPVESKLDTNDLSSYSTYSNHSVWVYKNGDAYGIGDNTDLIIDPRSKDKKWSKPFLIKFISKNFINEKIISAVCGSTYTLYLTDGFDRDTRSPVKVVHFVDSYFSQSPNSFYFDSNVYIFGGSTYAGIITESNELHIIKGNPCRKNVFSKYKICDVALCDTYTIAISEDNSIMSFPAGDSEFKLTKYRKLSDKCKIHTISGTHDIAVAIATEIKTNCYCLVIFQYLPGSKHPTNITININDYYENKIIFKYVSCSNSQFLLLATNGTVYSASGRMEELIKPNTYKKIKNIYSKVSFIISGLDKQVLFTTDIEDTMPNYHISEEIGYENEEEEEEVKEEEEFVEREDQNQKRLTLSEIQRVSQGELIFVNPEDMNNMFTPNQLSSSSCISRIFKVRLNTNIESEANMIGKQLLDTYAMKIFNYIHIKDYHKFIMKNQKFNNSKLYHPLIVKILFYNYDLKSLQDEKQRYLNIVHNQNSEKDNNDNQNSEEDNNNNQNSEKDNNDNQNSEKDNNEIQNNEKEAKAKIEDFHNFDLNIRLFSENKKNIFNQPLVLMPYFQINLYNAITSGKYSPTDKVLWISEILTTVAYLHDNKIYHQRLTPWNILIGKSNDAFISDIFNSEFVESEQEVLLKDPKALWFIDPEVINNDIATYELNDALKRRHDIYSIGKLIYFIISGSIEDFSNAKAFADRSILQYSNNNDVGKSETTENPIENIDYPSDFPMTAKNLINSCISFSKEGRPSAENILDQLINEMKFELIPNVNYRVIEYRLKIINEIIQDGNS